MAPGPIVVVAGTRPEVIKLSPLVLTLRESAPDLTTLFISSGQHREMLDQAMADFGLAPDLDLDVMTVGQTLPSLSAALLPRLDEVLATLEPSVVVVQGDTTTAFIAALAAFYRQIPVAHVEAGLRTGDVYSPFPEEMNRRLITQLGAVHFAPTTTARDNLLRDGVPAGNVHVTGNTAIDALRFVRPVDPDTAPWADLIGRRPRLCFATVHRRENHGGPLVDICQALAEIVQQRNDVSLVLPVHPNPKVQPIVHHQLAGLDGVLLTDPLPYSLTVAAMRACTLVVTDSGGLQEEAPAFDKPVLVLRRETERGEGIDAGVSVLVGTARTDITATVARLLDDADAYQRMAASPNPFGDGRASERMVPVLRNLASRA